MNVSDTLIFANMALIDILLGGGLDYYYHSSLFWIVGCQHVNLYSTVSIDSSYCFHNNKKTKEIIVLPKEYRCREITTNEFGL